MRTSSTKRVLFIAYQFPPVGGVGVHRVTKFVKYLPDFGWQSSVLTVSNPSVPLHDDSLLDDIPAGTIVRRAKTLEPGYALKNAVSQGKESKRNRLSPVSLLKSSARKAANMALQPDSQILWHRHAYREGLRLLNEAPHDSIIATGPPFSSLLLGQRLSRTTGVPLVLDYRDEWDISNTYWENKGQGPFSNWLQNRLQARALKQAQLVLATTPSSAAAIKSVTENAGSAAKVDYIYNGFDPSDYNDQSSTTKQDYGHGTDRFRLAFIGTLWNLNSIAPVVEALLKLTHNAPGLAQDFELLLAGRRTPDQEAVVDQLNGTPIAVTRLPFVSHSEAINLMQSSDSLLMLNSNVPKAQRIINAKVFEYMAAKRPMFVVAPEGDVWDLVRNLPGSVLCRPEDVSKIADQLSLQVEQHRMGLQVGSVRWEIDRFHRRNLTRELSQRLDELTGHSPHDPDSSASLEKQTTIKDQSDSGISDISQVDE